MLRPHIHWNVYQELVRKLAHIFVLIILLLLFDLSHEASKHAALVFLVLVLLLFMVLEFLRLDLGLRMWVYQLLVRPREYGTIHGAMHFVMAAIIVIAVFDPAIALASLFMATFGDMMAAIFGKKYGTAIFFKNKTMLGFGAGLVTNVIIGIGVSLAFSVNVYILMVMAFLATFVESLVEDVDDNLAVPVVSGFVGYLLLRWF